MSWVGVAVGGASLISGLLGSDASQQAAQDQMQAALNAQEIQTNEFNTITGQESPFMQSGLGSLGQLNYLLGIGTPGTSKQGLAPTAASSTAGGYGSLLTPFTADYMKQYSPAYQFQLQQGQQGVLNADTASQGALSGAALKDLTGYNQNYANTAFGNAFNQYQTQLGNTYSRLAGLTQLGQTAAANTGAAGVNLAGNAGQAAQNAGTAQAGGVVGSANAWTGALNNLSSIYAAYGGGGGSPYSSGSYNSVMGSGNFGGSNSYGSGYTFADYGAEPD